MSFLMLVLDDWMSRTTTGSRENQRKACSQVWSGARVPHENKINGGRFDKAKKKKMLPSSSLSSCFIVN